MPMLENVSKKLHFGNKQNNQTVKITNAEIFSASI